ncbi:MAG: ricin-type beta-trefoil lectin domain protein [Methylocella sp.]|nr:MAG: hypothetical protein DLM68_07470 [Hyphomicrobiales bacterium]
MPKGLRVFLLSSLLSVPFFGFSPAHAAVFTNGTNVSGTCLDDKGGLTGNSNPIQAFSCNVTFAQEWNFVGTVIQGIGTTGAGGHCVDVSGGGTAAGTVVQLFQCNGTVAQVWYYFNYQLINPNSGKCLDVLTGTAGTQARIEVCNGSAGQKWVIR